MELSSSFVRDLRLAVARRRRLIAAALAAMAAALAIESVQSPGPPAMEVVAARHDLPGGAVLTEDDLRTVRLPQGVVPEGSVTRLGDAVGQRLAGPIRRGAPLTDVSLFGPALLAGWGKDLVASPVRVADRSVAALLRPGDRVDVLAAAAGFGASGEDAAGPAQVVAASVPVLTIPAFGEDFGVQTGALVVLAVSRATAAELAQAAAHAQLTVSIRGSPV